MFRVLIGLLAMAACRAPAAALRPLPTGACLALDGAFRDAIQLAPDGDAAYWTETGWERDALNQLRSVQRIVRLDLATAATTTALAGVESPFRILPRGGLIARRVDGSSFTVARPGETPWDLVLPDDSDTVTNLAVDAAGDRVAIGHHTGAIDVFRLSDRHRERLPATGWLLYLDGNYVAYAHGDDWTVSETAPGLPSPRELGTLPGEGWFTTGKKVFYIKDEVIGVWQRGRPVEVLTTDPGTIWGYTAQGVVTNAASPSEATVFVGDDRWKLPVLAGGGRYAGAVRLGDGRFLALVAHDSRFDAAFDDSDERDVCVVPATGTITLPTRTMPRAYQPLTATAIATARALGKPDGYVLDQKEGFPPTLAFYLPGDGGDPAAMLAKITEVEHLVGTAPPREVRLAIYWDDDRLYARSWWSYRTEHRRADAGNRTARVERAGGAWVVFDDLELETAEQSLRCAGRLTNRSDHSLQLKVSCGDDWFRVRPRSVRPGEVGWWSARVNLPAGADVAVLRDHSHQVLTIHDDAVVWADPAADDRAATELARAGAVRAKSGLLPIDWEWSGGTAPVHVTLAAPAGFAESTDAERAASAATAQAALAEWIAAAAGAPAGTPSELTLEGEGSTRWRYHDGVVEVVDE